MGKGVWKIRFYFLLSYFDLMSNKCNQSPQVKSVFPMLATHYFSLVLPQPMSFSLYFLSPGQLRRGGTEWLWGAPGVQPWPTHQKLLVPEPYCLCFKHFCSAAVPDPTPRKAEHCCGQVIATAPLQSMVQMGQGVLPPLCVPRSRVQHTALKPRRAGRCQPSPQES